MAAVDFVEIALEETPRYEGAVTTVPYRISTDKLYLPSQSAILRPAPSHIDRADELRGIQGAVPRILDLFTPSGDISVRAYMQALVWLLELSGFKGVHTAGDGVITDPDSVAIPATAHRWVFNKRVHTVANGQMPTQTAQVRLNYASEDRLFTGQGFACSALGLNANGEATASLLGLVLAKAAADTTTSPTLLSSALQPARRGDLYLTWLANGGSVGDFNISIASPLDAVPTVSLPTPSNFPDVMEPGDARVYVTGSIPKRVLAAADYDALMNAATFAAKARWKTRSNIAATSYPHSMWVEMPACQYVGGDADALTNVRRRGATFDWFAAHDTTAGYDVKITVVTDVATIATYV